MRLLRPRLSGGGGGGLVVMVGLGGRAGGGWRWQPLPVPLARLVPASPPRLALVRALASRLAPRGSGGQSAAGDRCPLPAPVRTYKCRARPLRIVCARTPTATLHLSPQVAEDPGGSGLGTGRVGVLRGGAPRLEPVDATPGQSERETWGAAPPLAAIFLTPPTRTGVTHEAATPAGAAAAVRPASGGQDSVGPRHQLA